MSRHPPQPSKSSKLSPTSYPLHAFRYSSRASSRSPPTLRLPSPVPSPVPIELSASPPRASRSHDHDHHHHSEPHWNYRDTYAAPVARARTTAYASPALADSLISDDRADMVNSAQQVSDMGHEQSLDTERPWEPGLERELDRVESFTLDTLKTIAEADGVGLETTQTYGTRLHMPPSPYEKVHGYRAALDCGYDVAAQTKGCAIGGRKMERYDRCVPGAMPHL